MLARAATRTTTRRLAWRLRPLGGGSAVRLSHGSGTQVSGVERERLLRDLETALRDDARASQRLSELLSASTAQNLTRALAVVQREQQQIQASSASANAAGGSASGASAAATVSMQELKYVALQQGLPFVGFGFVDNAIMIIAGDYIDLTLGVSLGISSMAAAGIGNTISDIAGLGLGGVVEDFCARLGLPTPALSPAQMMLRETRVAKMAGSSVGVTIGCLLGMLPLLFMETREKPQPATAAVETA